MVRLSIILVLLLAFAPDWLLHALWLVFAIGLVAAWVDRRSHRGQGDDVARYSRALAIRRHHARKLPVTASVPKQ